MKFTPALRSSGKIISLILVLLVVVFTGTYDCFAQVASQPKPPGIGELFVRMLPMLIIVYFVFYFMVIRPQQSKLSAQEKMLAALKKGDTVLTSAGIVGRVAGVESDHILVEIATNVRVKFLRSKVLEKLDKAEELPRAAQS